MTTETMPVLIDGQEQERRIDYYEANEKRRGFLEPVPFLYEGEQYYRGVGGTTVIVKGQVT